MYFIKNTNYQNNKLNNLVRLKNELLEKNLLTTDKFFKNSIKNKNVEIQGFINIDKWTMHIIDLLKETSQIEWIRPPVYITRKVNVTRSKKMIKLLQIA